ncbi:MAG TPA: hypothetical protein PLA74_03235 [Syntrophales bacterium]|nr:hypothetical protein [Syntrophales bacterium]HPQ43007.1 hypothetical protein [Syntrophales bacterium]
MPDLDYLRIIKWVLIVLLAGFIGQFGKSLAKHLMEKARLKRKGSPSADGEAPSVTVDGTIENLSESQEPLSAVLSPEEQAKRDKKLAKTLAKQKKKEAKVLKKQGDR